MPGICPRCDKNVYFAEEVKGLGNVYHKLCFSCSACRKLLDSGSITEHDGKMYCNSCYRSVTFNTIRRTGSNRESEAENC